MKSFWVYILRCSDGSYYTGMTMDLKRRLAEHKSGEGSVWTKGRLPVQLVFQAQFENEEDAFRAERKIKRWSQAKKQALIRGDWETIRHFAKKPSFRPIRGGSQEKL